MSPKDPPQSPPSKSEWEPIDAHILAGRKLLALQAIRAARGSSLPEALGLLKGRYDHLRNSCPHRFTVGHENYWEGFHS